MLMIKIFYIFLQTTGSLFISLPLFQKSFFPANGNIFLLSAVLSVAALILVMFDCLLFFIHVCYYIISHYIQLIRVHPNANNVELEGVQVFTSEEKYWIHSFIFRAL